MPEIVCENNVCYVSDNIRGKLEDALGLKVIRAGIGDKVLYYRHYIIETFSFLRLADLAICRYT